LVSLVGPLANLALAFLGAVPFYILHWQPDFFLYHTNIPTVQYFLTQFIVFNLLLAFFNLVPIAPLDGAQVLGAFLSGQVQKAYDSVQRFGSYILLVVVFLLPQFLDFTLVDLLFKYFIAPIFWFLMSGTLS
jgi:Zn-dependent protease